MGYKTGPKEWVVEFTGEDSGLTERVGDVYDWDTAMNIARQRNEAANEPMCEMEPGHAVVVKVVVPTPPTPAEAMLVRIEEIIRSVGTPQFPDPIDTKQHVVRLKWIAIGMRAALRDEEAKKPVYAEMRPLVKLRRVQQDLNGW